MNRFASDTGPKSKIIFWRRGTLARLALELIHARVRVPVRQRYQLVRLMERELESDWHVLPRMTSAVRAVVRSQDGQRQFVDREVLGA